MRGRYSSDIQQQARQVNVSKVAPAGRADVTASWDGGANLFVNT